RSTRESIGPSSGPDESSGSSTYWRADGFRRAKPTFLIGAMPKLIDPMSLGSGRVRLFGAVQRAQAALADVAQLGDDAQVVVRVDQQLEGVEGAGAAHLGG